MARAGIRKAEPRVEQSDTFLPSRPQRRAGVAGAEERRRRGDL